MLSSSDYKECRQRKRARSRFFDEVVDEMDAASVINLNAKDKFRIQTFLFIVDKLIIEMSKRREAYEMLYFRFNFMIDRNIAESEIISKS